MSRSVQKNKPKRTTKPKQKAKPQSDSDGQFFAEDDGIDIEIGFEFKGMGASISTQGILKLGAGIAAVELDLKEPNNSKLSYVWDLYEIEGERDGCSVVLTYRIAGVDVKTETRKIPKCEDEEREPEEPEEPEEGEDGSSELPKGNPNDIVFRVLPGRGYHSEYDRGLSLEVIRTYSNNRPRVFKAKHRNSYAFANYYRKGGNPVWDWNKFPPIDRDDPLWNEFFDDIWTFRYPNSKGGLMDYISLYIWFNNLNFRTSGWYAHRFVGFEGPRWWVDMETLNYWVGIWYQERDPPGWKTVHDDFSYYSEKFTIYCEHIIEEHKSSANSDTVANRRKTKKMDDCCKMVARIYEVLDVDEILDEGVETPNRWIAAGGKKHTKNKSYLDLITFQMKMQDHLGIHPFRAEVTDVNAALEGDQSSAVEFANATAAAKQIVELLLENKGDSAIKLNLMMRTAIAVGQVLNVVSIIAKTFEGVVQYLGMPIRERTIKVKMPFDFSFGQRGKTKSGQGFGKGTQSGVDELDINTEEATEALLPKFMADAEQPIRYEDFDDRENDLTDIIRRK